ncbi:hypothetical protein N431DRAFT_480390 [Stipitochalara longipes BDJ]|nr:hypothetical protein N431DRAFT_480390 [Stipitochalara longipes BDJ]
MSLTPPSRVTKSKAPPKKTHRSSPRSTTSPSATSLISLETYVSNIFFDIIIQDQDDIAELAFKRNFSTHVKETVDGRPLTYKATHDLIFQLRSTITNRQLISHSFVVAPTPGDTEGRTGSVAHIAQFSGVQDGKEIVGNDVAVFQIGWNEKEMRRQVVMESSVLAVS